MPLTISNNSAVAAASYHLGKNQSLLQLSIKKKLQRHPHLPPRGIPKQLGAARDHRLRDGIGPSGFGRNVSSAQLLH